MIMECSPLKSISEIEHVAQDFMVEFGNLFQHCLSNLQKLFRLNCFRKMSELSDSELTNSDKMHFL